MTGGNQSFSRAEIKAGLLVFAALAVGLLFVGAIHGFRPRAVTVSYQASFQDTLGLNPGADVRFGGAKVGRVTTIQLDPEDQSRIQVAFALQPDVPINTASVAYVGQTSLTAEKHLEITTGDPMAARTPPGAEIPVQHKDLFGLADTLGVKVAEVLDGVKRILGADGSLDQQEIVSLPHILGNVDGAVSDVRAVLADNRHHVEDVLLRLKDIQDAAHEVVGQIEGMVSENRDGIQSTVDDLSGAAANVEVATARVQGILDDVAAATAQLDGMAATIDTILENTEHLSADARALVETNRTDIETVLLDLQETILYIKEFARTVAEQPQSVVRGRQPQGRR